MAEKEATLAERVQTSYKQLFLAATNLNIASDELTKAISALQVALEKLNLGISAWTTITSGGDDAGRYWWSRDLGYTQIDNRWVIALRDCSGDYTYPDEESNSVWPFNTAPRWMQNEAVAKIPDLIEKLTEQAEETRKKLRNRAKQAFELAAIIEEVGRNEDDWRGKLEAALRAVDLPASADALAQPEAGVALVNNALTIKAPKRYEPQFADLEIIQRALTHLGHPDLPFKLIFVGDQKNPVERIALKREKNR